MARGQDLSPRDVGRVLDDSLSIYRSGFKTIAGGALLVLLPFALFQSVSQVFYLRGMLHVWNTLITNPSKPPTEDPGMMAAYALSGTAALAYLIGGLYFRACIYRFAPQFMSGRPPGIREMLKGGWTLFLPITIAGVVAYMATTFVSAVSFMTLGIGGLIMQVLFVVAAPVIAFEGKDAIASIKRSFALVGGHFWRVALVLIAVGVISSQLRGALMSPITIRDVVFAAQNPTAPFPDLPLLWKVAEGIVQGIALVLVAPLADIVLLRCYLDLRSRSEGMDLLMRARELAA